MKFTRASGILLHPTSFPGNHGIGDFGEYAYAFIDFLSLSNQKLWQICPLGPTGFGNSPYQCFSVFAGNPLLIDLNKLVEKNYLTASDLTNTPPFKENRIEFQKVIQYKNSLFKKAFNVFKNKGDSNEYKEFTSFSLENIDWLDDYALFMALKDAHNGEPWNKWEKGLVYRNKETLNKWIEILGQEILYHKFLQYEFFKQWLSLKSYANEKNIKIIGDIPIFPAYDSVDVWAHPWYFQLDSQLNPIKVAGVPPDYFNSKGQLWGNPLYNWEIHRETKYKWWIKRMRMFSHIFDIVRIDHFRGFHSYYTIPYGLDTAENGEWEFGPGRELFNEIKKAVGDIQVIAEDLGEMTSEVEKLRTDLGFPGMKILQFAFDSNSDNPYLPHLYKKNCVVYTGTHDNDTTLGWYKKAPEKTRNFAKRYIPISDDIVWSFIRLAFSSTAALAIIPLQDILSLNSDARLNTPGTVEGNWQWRYTKDMLKKEVAYKLRELTALYGR